MSAWIIKNSKIASSIVSSLLSIAFMKFLTLFDSGSGMSKGRTGFSRGVNSNPPSWPQSPTAILPYPSSTALRRFSLVMLAITASLGKPSILPQLYVPGLALRGFPLNQAYVAFCEAAVAMKTEWQLSAPSFHIFYNDIIAENLSKSKEENQGHIRLALAMPSIEAKGYGSLHL